MLDAARVVRRVESAVAVSVPRPTMRRHAIGKKARRNKFWMGNGAEYRMYGSLSAQFRRNPAESGGPLGISDAKHVKVRA